MKKLFSYEKFKNESVENRTISSYGQLEFQTAFDWIKTFGGKELLSSKHINNGHILLLALMNKHITISEIDNVTIGDHGQMDNLPFSETTVAKNTLIPVLKNIEMNKDSDKYNI